MVIENFRPDVKRRLKIDYPDLKAVNPRIIYASISAYGQDGPYATWPGFDQIAQGMGGLMSVTGLPGQGPVRAGAAVADMAAGLFAALGVMVALLEREKSGEGQYVETSLLAAQIFMLDFQAARWLIDKVRAAARPATIIRPAFRPASTRPRTATSTSRPPARRPGCASARRSTREHLIEHPDYATNALRLEESRRAECGYRKRACEQHQRRTGSRS